MAYGQSKKKPKKEDTPKDTVVIYKKANEGKKPAYIGGLGSSMKEKVTVIRPSDSTRKKPRIGDTIVIVKKGIKKSIAERKEEEAKQIMKNNNYCRCVKMDIDVSTVLQYETYLNYKFIFKNNCAIDVWVSSKHFRFVPYNSFGRKAKVIRELSFVQRYDHPAFVKLEPGESYTFNYGDDAFFEYELQKGQTYKFVFEHRNFGDRSKMAPEKTYLCHQERAQLITIK